MIKIEILYKCFSLLLLTALLNGCALVSGSKAVPISANDRELIQHAFATVQSDVPFIRHPVDGRPVHQLIIGFDGTMNDRERIPSDEKPTIVADMMTRLGGQYFPGPGMQNPHYRNLLDGMFGYSSADIAQLASEQALAQSRQWMSLHPDGEIRIVVTGFSRGAAIARHFMNLLTAAADQDAQLRHKVYFYAILFDTVSTGQLDKLDLTLPTSVDYMVHFVARDESRYLFKPVIDEEPDITTRVYHLGGPIAPPRVNRIVLPGSHSDVGRAYGKGIGMLYQQLTEQLLYQMGLIRQNCWDGTDEALLAGKHDSRGLLERVTGVAPPNSSGFTERQMISKQYPNPSMERSGEIDSRLIAMSLANAERGVNMQSYSQQLVPLNLVVRREGGKLSVLDWNQREYIDSASFSFSDKDGVRLLRYNFLPPYQEGGSTLLLNSQIWDRLPENQAAVLSYSFLTHEDEEETIVFVNDVIVASFPQHRAGARQTSHERSCGVNANGELRGKMRSFIIEAGTFKVRELDESGI
ncbi:hypothetical protein GJ698_17260 [Pseudoduganella sp. FT26W]|uniref:DUF2235 domain-containing protein n=1 Tax=Duganella aquatilis TaxID=2666082 RepID=A0A844CYD4_9BURK|nr:DUF2235 domain-containing protein [Duganella aquatilis]MRW85827.1 hypothetical protein [Duganella aquatilis]